MALGVARAAALALAVFAAPPATAKFCGVNIDTVPEGAEVYVQGRAMGRAPVLYVHGSESRVRVRVIREGFEPWEGEVDIQLDTITSLTVKLVPLARKKSGR